MKKPEERIYTFSELCHLFHVATGSPVFLTLDHDIPVQLIWTRTNDILEYNSLRKVPVKYLIHPRLEVFRDAVQLLIVIAG